MKKEEKTPQSVDEPIDAEILEKLEEMPTKEILAQIVMGPYPPPDMMAAYREECPEVYEQIVDGVKHQREHRMRIEEKQSSTAALIRNRSELNQSIFSYLAIVGAVLLIGFQLLLFGDVKHYATSLVLAVLGVGGKPTATILAKFLDKWNKTE